MHRAEPNRGAAGSHGSSSYGKARCCVFLLFAFAWHTSGGFLSLHMLAVETADPLAGGGTP
eukprot:6767110-Prymnesium_polylepis.1